MDYHHLLEAAGIVVSGVLFYSLAYGWFETERSTAKLRDDAGR